jgi:hypothetical protein
MSAVANLHPQNTDGQRNRDRIGDHDGPGAHQEAVNQPKCQACGEAAVHAQRDTAYIAGAEGFQGLGYEAHRGQEGGDVANNVNKRHDGGAYLLQNSERLAQALYGLEAKNA